MATLIEHAVALLNAGELVAFPTETVYGLGADATNPDAVKKIFATKGRPADHPVIVHIYALEQLNDLSTSIPDVAYQLAKHFWPGPMTLILPAANAVPSIITGGQSSIGIRMPGHPMTRELLQAFGGAIAAPSANRFGRISPTTAEHVRKELGDKVKLILDGGPCTYGLESTIIDLTHKPPRLLRPGPLNIEQIEKISGVKVVEDNQDAPRVSGSLASHYSPVTPVFLLTIDEIRSQLKQNSHIAVISYSEDLGNLCHQMPSNPGAYAHDLYAILRELDEAHPEKILIEIPPESIAWQAIHDRLRRAAVKVWL